MAARGKLLAFGWAAAGGLAGFAAIAAGWASLTEIGWPQLALAAAAAFSAAALAYREYESRAAEKAAHATVGPPATTTVAVPAALPADITHFTGRHEETLRLLRVLRATGSAGLRAVVVSAVSGQGGVGKTRLAVHVAHLVRRDFPDGQLYVDLRGAEGEALDPDTVVGGFLADLGVPEASVPERADERVRMYRTTLSRRQVLVVLDNARDERQVRPLLPGSSGCAALITSRATLAGLDGAMLLALDVMPPADARELLARIAGEERVAAEPAEAERIVRLCGYLPLAVRVAGAQLAARPGQTLRGLAARLSDERSRLDRLRVGDIEVRTTLAIGYHHRPEPEQRLFRLLGGLRFADVPAWAVAVLADVDLAGAERLSDQLVDVGLLDAVGEDAAGQLRYRMHDLVRLIARERTEREDPPEERRARATAVLDAHLAAARLAVDQLDRLDGTDGAPPDGLRALSRVGVFDPIAADPEGWLRMERENLALAVEHAYDERLDDLACRLAVTLTDYYDTYSLWEQWERSHLCALAAARRLGDRAAESGLLWRLGRRYRHGRPEEALATYEESLRGYRGLGDRAGEARVLLEMGVVHREQGALARAGGAYAACLRIFVELGDRRWEAYALRRLAFVETDQAALAEAVEHFDRCLALLAEFGDVRWTARTLRGISIVHRLLGRYDDAEDTATRALEAFRAVKDERGGGYALLDLGDVRAVRGDAEAAVGLFEEAVAVFRTVGDERGEAYTLLDLAAVHGYRGRFAEAAATAERAAKLCAAIRDRRGETWVDLCVADLARVQGERAEAADGYARCLASFEELGDRVGTAHVLLRRGLLEAGGGDIEAAHLSWRAAAVIYAAARMPEAELLESWLAREQPGAVGLAGIGRLRFPPPAGATGSLH